MNALPPNWKHWFSFTGRTGRAGFWRTMLVLLGANMILSALVGQPGGAVLTLVLGLPLTWISFAVTARRLHDLGRPGWWQFPPMLLGLMALRSGVELMKQAEPPTGPMLLVTVGALLNLAFLVVIGARRGGADPNAYGPPPGRS